MALAFRPQLAKRSESPIEERMVGIIGSLPAGGLFGRVDFLGEDAVNLGQIDDAVGRTLDDAAPSQRPVLLVGQQIMVRDAARDRHWRVDFMLAGLTFVARSGRIWLSHHERLIVECDGHGHHHADPEQVEIDNARYRRLTDLGHRFYRFSGSQIWSDPAGIAAEIETHFRQRFAQILGA